MANRTLKPGERTCLDCPADLAGSSIQRLRCDACNRKIKNAFHRSVRPRERGRQVAMQCAICGFRYTDVGAFPRKTCSHLTGKDCAEVLRVRNATAARLANGTAGGKGTVEVGKGSRNRRWCLRDGVLCRHYVGRAISWRGFVACCQGGNGYEAEAGPRAIEHEARVKAIDPCNY